MITQDNLKPHVGLYARANGVLLNSAISVTDAYGVTKSVKELAKANHRPVKFTEDCIDNIHIYFQFLDILAAYEAAQILAMSKEESVEPISYKIKELAVNADTGLLEEIEKIVEAEEFQPIFTMLPADEPRFKVNLNTRRIESPAGFVGQQVQNDTFAETLWFEVDRYFDTTDLFGTDISIQWESGKEKGITEAFNPMANLIVDDLYGKVIFGWPLTEEVTKTIGNVRFSIRFCKKDTDGSIIYNLTTLPMNLKINESLIIEPNSEVVVLEPHTRFYKNLKKKSFYTVIPAAIPELKELYGLTSDDKKLSVSGNLGEDGLLILEARGEVSDSANGRAGSISYEWVCYIDEDNGIQQIKKEGVLIEKEGKIYSQLKADAAGAYGVIIANNYGGNTQFYIPPFKTVNEDGSISLNKAELFEIPFANIPVFKAEGDKEIISKVIGDASAKISFTKESDKNETAYQWFFSRDNGVSDAYSNDEDWVANAKTSELTLSPIGLNEGYYKLEATNSLNKTTAAAMTEQAYRVTYSPVPVKVAGFEVNKKTVEAETSGVTMIIENKEASITPILGANTNKLFDEELDSDSVSVKWYFMKNGTERIDAPNANAAGTLTVGNELQEGRYICEVTTKYNGSSEALLFDVYVGV